MALDICKPSEVRDDDQIVSAVYVSFPNHPTITRCYSLRFWDDGYGPVWNYRDASGLDAIIRAQTWHDAYECFIDEIADDADRTYVIENDDTGELPEGMHYRGNGVPSSNWGNHETDIAQTDLNGEVLEPCADMRDDDRRYYLIVERDE